MSDQINYNGKWIPKHLFRTFVFKNGAQKLANSHDEYINLMLEGWKDSSVEESITPLDLDIAVDENLETEPLYIVKRGRKRANEEGL